MAALSAEGAVASGGCSPPPVRDRRASRSAIPPAAAQEGRSRKAGRRSEREEEHRDGAERARLPGELPADLQPEPGLLILSRDAGDRDRGGDGDEEGRDLGDEAVADREERVAPGRLPERHAPQGAGGEAADDVDQDDGHPRDRVPLHELERAVHRPVEPALPLQGTPPPPRLRRVDEA
jgi:hypothetical protein